MDKFTLLTTGAVALEADNIDTDQIMPKQFLRGIDKSGLDKGLFYNLKHKADGSLDPKSCARILKLFLLLISPHGRFVPATLLSALRLHRVTAACSSWALTWSIRRSPKSMRSSVFANSTNGSFRG